MDNSFSLSDISLKNTIKLKSCVSSMALSHDKRFIFIIFVEEQEYSDEYVVEMWSASSWMPIKEFYRSTEELNCIYCTWRDDFIIVGSYGNVTIWNTKTSQLEREIKTSAYSVCTSRDDAYVFTGSNNISVFEFPHGKRKFKLVGHKDTVNSLIVTHDNKHLISAADDKLVKIWDLENGTCLHTLAGHTYWVMHVIITKDDKYIISASSDRTIKIWDKESASLVQTLEGHLSGVNHLALSEDDEFILSASNDKSIKFWHLKTGTCWKTITPTTSAMECALFNRNEIVAVSWNKKLMILR